jgi:hypothetical protein
MTIDRSIWAWAIRIAVKEGRPERLMQLIVKREIPQQYRPHVARLVQLGAIRGIRGNAKKRLTDSSTRYAIHAAYLMYTAEFSHEEAIGQLADDTKLSESTIARIVKELSKR